MTNYPVMDPESQTPNTTNSARDFVTVLFKHKARIIKVFLAVVVTVMVVTFLITPTYEAKTTLLMKIGREHLNRNDLGENSPVNSNLRQEEIINSEIAILTSGELMEKVINSLSVENIYPDLAKAKFRGEMKPVHAAMLRFRKDLTVNTIRKSNVVEVKFRHKNPKMAAKALNTLVDFFREKHLQVYSDPRSSFFESQLGEYEQKLRESAAKLEAFKQKNGVYSLEEQRTLLLKQRADLDALHKTSESSVSELQRRLAVLRGQFKSISNSKKHYTTTEGDRVITEAKSRLLALQLNEKELLQKYREESPLVKNNRDEIRMVRQFVKEQEESLWDKAKSNNPTYQGVEGEMLKAEADLTAQRARAGSLRQQLGKLNSEIRSLDLRENDLQSLKREMSTYEKNQQVYRDKAEEARIAEDMNKRKLANISVIQEAVPPIKHISPKKKVNLAIGVVVGLIAAVALAFLSEALSQAISTPGNAEKRLGVPVLAVIPYKE